MIRKWYMSSLCQCFIWNLILYSRDNLICVKIEQQLYIALDFGVWSFHLSNKDIISGQRALYWNCRGQYFFKNQNRTSVAFDGRKPKILNNYKQRWICISKRCFSVWQWFDNDSTNAKRINGRVTVSITFYDYRYFGWWRCSKCWCRIALEPRSCWKWRTITVTRKSSARFKRRHCK